MNDAVFQAVTSYIDRVTQGGATHLLGIVIDDDLPVDVVVFAPNRMMLNTAEYWDFRARIEAAGMHLQQQA